MKINIYIITLKMKTSIANKQKQSQGGINSKTPHHKIDLTAEIEKKQP
jgi:hypothetical protein